MASKSRKKQLRKAARQNLRARVTSSNTITGSGVPIIVPADSSRTSFSDLPPELRNLIYEYALAPSPDKPLRLNAGSGVGKEIAIHLLSTCRRVRNEATGILYKGNTFRIDLLRINWSTLHDVIGSHECVATCPLPLYRSHPYALLECPRMLELYKPGLFRTLDLFDPKQLGRISSFVFCLHVKTPTREEAMTPTAHLVSGEPKVLVHLDFMKRAPYYKIAVEVQNGVEGTRGIGKQDYQWVSDHIQAFMEDTITCRCLRGLGRDNILLFSDWIEQHCRELQ